MTEDSPNFDGNKPEEIHFASSLASLFPQLQGPIPEMLSAPCCSQFAVTRRAIHRIPRQQYADFVRWLEDAKLGSDITGRVWERVWHWMWLGKAQECPVEWKALCLGWGVCFDDRAGFDIWRDLINEKKGIDEIWRSEEEEKDGQEGERSSAAAEKQSKNLGMTVEELRRRAIVNGKDLKRRQQIVGDLYIDD